MKRKVIAFTIAAIWISLIGLLCYRAYDYYIEKDYEVNTFSSEEIDLEDEIIILPPQSVDISEPTERELRLADPKLSEDVVGWIEIPGLEINDPIVQGNDNEFYLHYDEYKEPTIFGAYFVNIENKFDDVMNMDNVTTIFGHANGQATSPRFAHLKNLKDPEYAANCRTIHVWWGDTKTTWRVFAVGDYPVGTEDNNYMIPNPSEEYLSDELELMKVYSYHTYDVPVTPNDKILVLSTCTAARQYETRFIVCAKLVSIGG